MNQFFAGLFCMLHGWRAAVWNARMTTPPFDVETASQLKWDAWQQVCKIMAKYHHRRHCEIREYMARIDVKYFDPKELP